MDVICGDAAAHARSFQPDGVYLEPAAWQELLAGPLLEAMRQAGVNTTIDYTPDHAAKEVRIRRLTEPICQRSIRFKSRSPGRNSGPSAGKSRAGAGSDYEKAAIVGAFGETLVATVPAST